jgi:hypothetical protein
MKKSKEKFLKYLKTDETVNKRYLKF